MESPPSDDPEEQSDGEKTGHRGWGPRKTGKRFLINKLYPNTRRLDLLDTDNFSKYLVRNLPLFSDFLRAAAFSDSEITGKAFENWLFHELKSYLLWRGEIF